MWQACLELIDCGILRYIVSDTDHLTRRFASYFRPCVQVQVASETDPTPVALHIVGWKLTVSCAKALMAALESAVSAGAMGSVTKLRFVRAALCDDVSSVCQAAS